jgi:hypothetical protein
MSLHVNIEHLVSAPGIEAVEVITSHGDRAFRGEARWTAALEGSLALFAKTHPEDSIRVVLSTHTVVVQREGDEIVAVILPTGHAIAKSLRRMIRRMARKDRAPLTAAEARSITAEAHAMVAAASQS